MNKLFKNTFIYTIGRIIPQLSGFILLPIYTKYMNPSEYGIVQSMQALGVILLVFFSLGSERSIFRLYHDYKGDQVKVFIGNIFILILIISLCCYGGILLFYNYFGRIFGSIDFFPYYLLSMTNALFLTFSYIPNNLYQVKGKALTFTIFSLSAFTIGVLCILYFVVVKDEKALGMLKGQAVGNGIMLFAYIPVIMKNARFQLSKKIMSNVLSFSVPMIPAFLSAWLLNMSNRVFLEHFIPDPKDALTEIGIYSLAFKIASICTVILGAFKTAYSPIFFEKANNQELESAQTELSKLNFVYASTSLIICFIISIFAKEVVILVFSEEYRQAYLLIPIIALAFFLSQLNGLYTMMIYQKKKTGVVMWIILLSAVISVIGNLLFIPHYKSFGAAWSTVLGVGCSLVLTMHYAKNYYYVPFNLRRILLIGLLFILIIYLDFQIDTINVWLSFIIKSLLSLVSVVFLLMKYKSSVLLLAKKTQVSAVVKPDRV